MIGCCVPLVGLELGSDVVQSHDRPVAGAGDRRQLLAQEEQEGAVNEGERHPSEQLREGNVGLRCLLTEGNAFRVIHHEGQENLREVLPHHSLITQESCPHQLIRRSVEEGSANEPHQGPSGIDVELAGVADEERGGVGVLFGMHRCIRLTQVSAHRWLRSTQ